MVTQQDVLICRFLRFIPSSPWQPFESLLSFRNLAPFYTIVHHLIREQGGLMSAGNVTLCGVLLLPCSELTEVGLFSLLK